MRRFEHGGRQYELTEKDYKKLLAKLDTSKAQECYGTYTISNGCICPHENAQECYICPLGPMKANCLRLLSVVADMKRPKGMVFNVEDLSWTMSSKKVVEYLDAARQKLLTLERC